MDSGESALSYETLNRRSDFGCLCTKIGSRQVLFVAVVRSYADAGGSVTQVAMNRAASVN